MAIAFSIVRCLVADSDINRVRLAAYINRGTGVSSALQVPPRIASYGSPSVYAATLPAIGNLPPVLFSGRNDLVQRAPNAQTLNLRRAVSSCLPPRLPPEQYRRLACDWAECRYTWRGVPDLVVAQVTNSRAGLRCAHLICRRGG